MLAGAALRPLTDGLGRPLRDLRISVTDRCNFRCNYCMPKEVFDRGHVFLAHKELLSFEEITRLDKESLPPLNRSRLERILGLSVWLDLYQPRLIL